MSGNPLEPILLNQHGNMVVDRLTTSCIVRMYWIGQSAGKVSHRRYDKTKILPQRLPDYWFMVLITLYELMV